MGLLLSDLLPKKPALSEFEKAIQDAEMPRCPLCRRPLKIGEDMACIQAHGMIAAVHEACRNAVMQRSRANAG